GTDVRALARRLSPSFPSVRAEVLLRPATGVGLRRLAESVTPDPDGSGWDVVVVDGPTHQLAAEILTYGPDAVVQSPQALREEIVERLRAVVGALA
ncbi:MAG: WYL domain-containing protein, partial [Nocardioides sp.]|nr:WYL domain-containing protein [Nocardioides sp.]